MDCDVCQTEKATVFFTQLADGKLQQVNLCKDCADGKGVTDPTGYALADMLEGMGEERRAETVEDPEETYCPSCGFSQTDFKKTGRFGCAECYHVFDDGLDGLLEAMHKHTHHVGKVPANIPALSRPDSGGGRAEPAGGAAEKMKPSPLDKLGELKEALSKSVEDEDYEEAARLRDEISQLESRAGDS